jgi:hypothetical protein
VEKGDEMKSLGFWLPCIAEGDNEYGTTDVGVGYSDSHANPEFEKADTLSV